MSAVTQWYRLIVEQWRAYRLREELLQLDERTLNDIGLQRRDI